MGLGDEIRREFAVDFQEAAARKIVTGIARWRMGGKVRTAQRRWAFELIQNALDAAKERQAPHLRIEIFRKNGDLIIRHNAGYFTPYEIRALVFAYSTKPLDRESELAGRFGSGSLVTHILSRRMQVRGAIEREGRLYRFDMPIDRESDDPTAVCRSFGHSFDQLNNAVLMDNEDKECWTEYVYRLKSDREREAATVGISEALSCAPFLFSFSHLDELEIDGRGFSRGLPTHVDSSVSFQDTGATRIWVCRSEHDDVSVGVPIDLASGEAQDLSAMPRIYVKGLPLVETGDYIGIPFAVHSASFETTEDRDNLAQIESNQQKLAMAFDRYRIIVDHLSRQAQDAVTKRYYLVDFHLVPQERTSQNALLVYLNALITDTSGALVKEVPLVDTVDGCCRAMVDVAFPSRSIKMTEIPPALFNDFYDVLGMVRQDIPVQTELDAWISVASRLSQELDSERNIRLYGIEDLRDEITGFALDPSTEVVDLDALGEHYGLSDAREFLVSFVRIIEELYVTTQIVSPQFVDAMVPDQSGNLVEVEDTFSLDLGIPDKLKGLMNAIGWTIEWDLVDREFGEFAVVRDLVRRELDAKGAVSIAVAKHSLQGGYGQSAEQDMAVDGWMELLKWCAMHDALCTGLSVLTKDEEPQVIENLDNPAFIIPFVAMGIDQEFEDIYPSDRILHPKYFQIGAAQQLAGCLRQRAFVTSLPLYSSTLTLSDRKLESVLLQKHSVAKGEHKMQCQNGAIASLPFWNEVIGNVSDFQDRARLLFRFCVEYLIQVDSSWQDTAGVSCSCREKSHTIIPSQWLASMIGDAWLPFKVTQGNEEKNDKRQATREGIENLFTQSEIDEMLTNDPNRVTAFLIHFKFDELDLKVKLRSAESGQSESVVRKEAAMLVEIGGRVPDLVTLANRNMDALVSTIEKLKESLAREPLRNENKVIGENVERILREYAKGQGLRVFPLHKGGDFEFWSESNDGWSGGLIEIGHYLAEVKFTSGTKVHLSTAQSVMARDKRDKYVVLIVTNAADLRDRLKEPLDDDDITQGILADVLDSSRALPGISEKLGDVPNPDEVEPDINGYWIKQRLWRNADGIPQWFERTFGQS